MSDGIFPIVKIDRVTGQDFLPLLMQKGIFSNYRELPTEEELLRKAKISNGGIELSGDQKRSVLSNAEIYRTESNVIHDYGTYTIGFGLGFSANDTDEAIDNALGRLSLYRQGHKLATIILAEVYQQRRCENIVLPKQRILEYLGYTAKEKQIYRQLDNVMFSLMTMNYYVYQFRTNAHTKIKSRKLGFFIYDVQSDQKNYTLSVNPHFVGSVVDVLNNEEKKRDLSRGYFSYPTSILPATKDYSTAAYMLSTFLIMESGNAKLSEYKHKVVAHTVRRLLEVMNLHRADPSKMKKAFLDSLAEVKIISKTTPTIKELSAMKASRLLDQVLHIHLYDDIKRLDDSIKSNLLGRKMG